MADDLTLVVGGANLSGWDDTEVTRGIERMPSTFALGLTERFPGQADFVVQPGDAAVVKLGDDEVITGYVDTYSASLASDDHSVRVKGRSKSRDLVDACAEWPGGQIKGATAKEIAQKLADPYGITIQAEGDVGPAIPQFNLTLGETGAAIIERIARYRGLLMFDMPNGDVKLGPVGAGRHSSGVEQGKNLQAGEVTYSDDERFSDYEAWLQSVDTFTDLGDGGNLLFHATDAGQKHHRLRDIIAEAGGGGQDVAKKRAQWECNRRAGRSYALSFTVDSWRDDAGTLWTPGFAIPVRAPALKVPPYNWVIGQVTYRKSAQGGTTAQLLIMPRPAFLPEPILLQPVPADVTPQ